MLADLGPSGATRPEKRQKMGRAQNTVKRGTFWRPGVSPAGAAAPLSYGEERTAVRQGHGQGAPGRNKGLRPLPPTPWVEPNFAFSCRQLGSKYRAAGLKHHGSEGRIGPAAGSPSCQTLLSELPRN